MLERIEGVGFLFESALRSAEGQERCKKSTHGVQQRRRLVFALVPHLGTSVNVVACSLIVSSLGSCDSTSSDSPIMYASIPSTPASLISLTIAISLSALILPNPSPA